MATLTSPCLGRRLAYGTFDKCTLWLSATTHAITKKKSACDNDVFGSQRGVKFIRAVRV